MEYENVGRRKAMGLGDLGFLAVASASTWAIHKLYSKYNNL